MCRRTAAIGFALLGSTCLLATAMGCCGACGHGSMHGYVVDGPGGCDRQCDRYAPRVYHHVCCRGARRDPRIPGPRTVNTLPAEPDMEAPSYFHPVPTYPVFGPRSEQPDGIEPQMQPLLPGREMDGEPLPAPRLRQPDAMDGQSAADDVPEGDLSDDLSDNSLPEIGQEGPRLSLASQTTAQDGWKPARKQAARVKSATRPSASCSVTFRRPSASQR